MALTEHALNPEHLVYIAGAFYVTGLAITNQIVLRLFVLTGTGLYIVYYLTVGDRPLWEAVYVSMLIGASNIGGLSSLILRRSRLAIPRAHADLNGDFSELPPGDFRSLMKLARRYTLTEDRQVTAEGSPGDRLYYIVSGASLVRKEDKAFTLPSKIFLGEIAFLTGVPSSASVWLEEGSEVLEWSFETLERKCARNPRFKLALEAAISIDLASKVARYMGRDSVGLDRIPGPMMEALPASRRA